MHGEHRLWHQAVQCPRKARWRSTAKMTYRIITVTPLAELPLNTYHHGVLNWCFLYQFLIFPYLTHFLQSHSPGWELLTRQAYVHSLSKAQTNGTWHTKVYRHCLAMNSQVHTYTSHMQKKYSRKYFILCRIKTKMCLNKYNINCTDFFMGKTTKFYWMT